MLLHVADHAYAAQIDDVIAVAAITPSRDRALYSTTGSYIEIAAPAGAGSFGSSSEQIWQLGPNQSDLVLAPGRLAPAFNRSQNLGFAGTSMATPHVTALAALRYAQGITNPAAIEVAIKRVARDLGPQGRGWPWECSDQADPIAGFEARNIACSVFALGTTPAGASSCLRPFSSSCCSLSCPGWQAIRSPISISSARFGRAD
jgi:hypothetical protein